MSQQLINHSKDLKRLRDEGYSLQIKGGYLCIHQIPYVTSSKAIKMGTLVSELTIINNSLAARPGNHVIFFIGEQPCHKDGSIITGIQHGIGDQWLTDALVVNRSFSNKPANGYQDYYEKVTTYATIISSPAKAIDTSITEKSFSIIPDENDETVFNYIDTNSSRANIAHINRKLQNQKIAIIGLGGTGAYILDLISKTPVLEIHAYDGDDFLQHNAFRSPCPPSQEELKQRAKKVEYYASVYSRMHKGVKVHGYYITDSNLDELNDMSYVFICVDSDTARKLIIQHLLKMQVSFFDVGLGVNIVDDKLIGTVRVTTATNTKNNHLSNRVSFDAEENNDYASNIQIAELNCLNAVMAILKWKKLSGFYQDLQEEHHSTYSINVAQLRNEDTTI